MSRLDTKADMEARYATEDPWGFRDHADDHERKRRILAACRYLRGADYWFQRALDIGAGEGWITKDLPAHEIFAYEISDRAASRLPDGIVRLTEDTLPATATGWPLAFGLIIATGVFYDHYDWKKMHRMVNLFTFGIVVTCHIEAHERRLEGTEIHTERFPYRGRTQVLRVYDFSGDE